jgi:hypothetical protein
MDERPNAFREDDNPLAGLTPAERAEIERAAEISEEDVDDAARQWRHDAPRELRDVLDATPAEEPDA